MAHPASAYTSYSPNESNVIRQSSAMLVELQLTEKPAAGVDVLAPCAANLLEFNVNGEISVNWTLNDASPVTLLAKSSVPRSFYLIIQG